jgi:osmoprotectant transport system permease protein
VSFFRYVLLNRAELLTSTVEHIGLVAVSSGLAILIGVPAGILLTRNPRLRAPVLGLANVVQTIPSLALFGFLIPIPFIGGIGARTAIIALVLYGMLPLIRNTYTGIASVDPAVREAARGMGMTDAQVLWIVELRLAAPVILAGIRIAVVLGVGIGTIAAAIGGGGLGEFIVRGVAMVNSAVILAGAVPAALLALIADGGLHLLERRLDWRR